MRQLQVVVPSAAEAERVKFTAHLVSIASRYVSEMYITSERTSIDLKSIMGMMTIVINSGKTFDIEITGIDEDDAAKAITDYFIEGRM